MTIGPVMRLKILIAAAALACGAGLFSQAALGQQQMTQSVPKHRGVAAVQPEQRTACTVLGCMTIPAVCEPVAGKTPGGLPTGYDVIVCPPGVWPLK
jgi:hypothetical protein